MTRVAIIGGGIGGLTAACALLRAGAEVSVYEAAGELKEIGAGVALHPNAMRVLRFIGVEDGVRKVAGRTECRGHPQRDQRAGHLQDQPGRPRWPRTASSQPPCTGPTCSTCSPRRCRRARVAWQALRVRRHRGRPRGRTVRGRHRRRGRRDRRRGRHPLGGAHVAVRPGRAPVHRQDLLPLGDTHGGDPRRRGAVRRGQRPVAGAARHDRALPAARRGTDQRGLPLRRRQLPARVVGDECSGDEVLERYAGWHESLLRLFAAGETWYKWALYDRDPIPAWTSGRVTLLGDAAHPMLPYLGQGACQAIEDGAVLATAWPPPPAIRSRPSAATSGCGGRGPRGSC